MCRFVLACLLLTGLFALDSTVRAQDPAAPTPVAAEAAPAPKPIRIPDLTGNWCGDWSSCTNGHKGPMRASFCKRCDGNYDVTFVGRFALLIPFKYTTTLTVTGYGDGVVYLTGCHHLGPLFGTFTFNGWANDREFVANYCSKKDQGQFHLFR